MLNDIFHLLWISDFKIRIILFTLLFVYYYSYNIINIIRIILFTFLRCYVILLSLDVLFHFLLLIFLQILILNYIFARNCKNRPENVV